MNSKINSTILITGASGNVGSSVVEELEKLNSNFIIGSASGKKMPNPEVRKLDFVDQNTFESALSGIKQIFLMRPPALSNVKKYFVPFLNKCKGMGIEYIVFLAYYLGGSLIEYNFLNLHHIFQDYFVLHLLLL